MLRGEHIVSSRQIRYALRRITLRRAAAARGLRFPEPLVRDKSVNWNNNRAEKMLKILRKTRIVSRLSIYFSFFFRAIVYLSRLKVQYLHFVPSCTRLCQKIEIHCGGNVCDICMAHINVKYSVRRTCNGAAYDISRGTGAEKDVHVT